MTFLEARAHIVRAINHAWAAGDDVRFARALADPSQDVEFDELKFDSLAAMEVCVELEDNAHVNIDPGDLIAHSSVNRLAAFLSGGQSSDE